MKKRNRIAFAAAVAAFATTAFAEQTIDWDKAQQAAFGAHDIELGGVIAERIDRTIDGHLMKIEFDGDLIQAFIDRKPLKRSIRIMETGETIEAIARYAALRESPALYDFGLDKTAKLIATQEPGGYLGVYPDNGGKASQRGPYDFEELGMMGHGLLTWYELYGRKPELEAALKLGDYLVDRIDFTGSPMIGPEEFLFRLSAATGDPEYLDFFSATFFPDGELCKYWTRLTGRENPDSIPSGSHHYRAMTMNRGMLLLHTVHNDEELLKTTDGMARFMRGGGGLIAGTSVYGEKSIVTHQGRSAVFNPLAGKLGAIKDGENKAGIRHTGETCANAWTLLLFEKMQDIRLGQANPDGWWMDAAERTLYNALFSGQSADGRRLAYATETEGVRTWKHQDSFCCANSYRFVISRLPGLTFSPMPDGVALHFYTPMQATFDLADGPVTLKQETEYPYDGRVSLSVDPESPAAFALCLRIPVWAKEASVQVNGEAVPSTPGHYLTIDRTWKPGDRVELDFPMEWRWIAGTYEQEGRAALMRGPMTFTFNPILPGNEIPGYEEPDYDPTVIVHRQDRPKYFRTIVKNGFPEYEDDYALLRQIVIDPDSLGKPERDPARPGGMTVTVKAQLPGVDGWREVTLTDFPDEGGRTMHFLLSKQPENLIKDPVFSPREGERYIDQIPAPKK